MCLRNLKEARVAGLEHDNESRSGDIGKENEQSDH